MIPYRTIKLEQFPDIGDIQGQGRASHVGRVYTSHGEYKNYNRSASSKRAIRRYWKRVDRQNQDKLEDYNEETICVYLD